MNRIAVWAMGVILAVSVCAGFARGDEVLVSQCFSGDTIASINDGVEPVSSKDKPRHSFWDHKGTEEWVEYHFDAPRNISATEVFWLDDTPEGQCPVPLSWQLFYREGESWVPVKHPTGFGVERDVFNRVAFEPVVTQALRMVVQLRPDKGAGIVEWDVQDDPERTRQRTLKRVLRAFDGLYCAPQETALLEHVRSTYGFSPEATAYFARMAEYEARMNALRGRVERGEACAPEEVVALAEEFKGTAAACVRTLPPLAFFMRYPLSRPNAANCAIWQSVPEQWGCRICVLDPSRPDSAPAVIFDAPEGSIYDMNLSVDAKTLFFSFRKQDEPCWQLYEIGVDGTGLKKIGRDPQYHEVGAIEMPSGELAFISTRRIGFTVCQPGPTSNLYVMDRDGGNVRCVSQNTLADFSPQMLADGRVLFTRWEYVDRDLTYRQSLWSQNPDGRRYQLYFGNTIRDVGVFWQARSIMNRPNLVVATFAPHHAWPHGAIGLIQNQLGPEAGKDKGFTYITREFDTIQDIEHRWGYRDPLPLNDYQFLVSCGLDYGRFALYLLDLCGNRSLIYAAPELGCYNALPLTPQRPAAKLAEAPTPSEDPDQNLHWSRVYVADVYQGLPEIERGRIKYIQIMEQMRKLADLERRAYDQSPVMSYATYYAKRCWGRVPVAEDGSAYFEVPALREIYLQVLDEEGREMQRMTSALQLMPGEAAGCIGCHENRQTSPPNSLTGLPQALKQAPLHPEFPDWGTEGVVDFVKVVQPVLDKYCVKCHSGPAPKAGYNFSGDTTRIFNMAYDNLLGRSRSYRQHDMQTGDLLPEEAQKGKPLVHFYWLLRTPTAVNRPFQTGSHASRLLEFIDSKHCGQAIPLEDRQRIYAWIDADVPYYATYTHTRPKSPGYRDLCTDFESGAPAAWYQNDFLPVYEARCASCHGAIPDSNDHARIWDGRFAWMNFTHPEWSSALTAHLAKEAGGWGLGVEAGGVGAPLFASKEDPDYLRMLNALNAARDDAQAHPRVDMAVR